MLLLRIKKRYANRQRKYLDKLNTIYETQQNPRIYLLYNNSNAHKIQVHKTIKLEKDKYFTR